jgi:hypothetical protein
MLLLTRDKLPPLCSERPGINLRSLSPTYLSKPVWCAQGPLILPAQKYSTPSFAFYMAKINFKSVTETWKILSSQIL